MRWTSVAYFGLAIVAATAARADDASRVKLAREVVEVAHAGDNMRAIMPVMAQQMRTMLTQQPGSDKADVDVYVQRFQDRFNKEIPDFVDLVAKVYAKEFTDDDLSNLLVFYRTPTGQHLLGKQQEIARGMLVAGQEWGKNIGQEVLSQMQKEKAAKPSPKL